MAELADARDSKSRSLHRECGFDPHFRHQTMDLKAIVEKLNSTLDDQRKEGSSLVIKNIEHKRNSFGYLFTILIGEITTIFVLSSTYNGSQQACIQNIGILNLIALFFVLISYQTYLFFLLEIEGEHAEKLTKGVSKVGEEIFKELEDCKTQQEIENLINSGRIPELYKQHCESSETIFSKIILSNYTPKFLFFFYFISQIIFIIFAVDLFRIVF